MGSNVTEPFVGRGTQIDVLPSETVLFCSRRNISTDNNDKMLLDVISENYLKNHALHAAFIVAKHDVVPMDLVAVDTASGKRLYSFLSIGWGLISDVDIESEKYRSMGNARFTLMAILKIASSCVTSFD